MGGRTFSFFEDFFSKKSKMLRSSMTGQSLYFSMIFPFFGFSVLMVSTVLNPAITGILYNAKISCIDFFDADFLSAFKSSSFFMVSSEAFSFSSFSIPSEIR